MHNSILLGSKRETYGQSTCKMTGEETHSCVCDQGKGWDWLPKCSCSHMQSLGKKEHDPQEIKI